MAKKVLPTVDHLRKRFDYDPVSGLITYKAITSNDLAGSAANSSAVRADDFNRRWAGQLAYVDDKRWSGGSRTPQLRLDGQNLSPHRVAWAMHYGEWPEDGLQIDHINGDPWDNRIENLRIATPSQNQANRKKGMGCTSEYKGVSYYRGKWTAQIAKKWQGKASWRI